MWHALAQSLGEELRDTTQKAGVEGAGYAAADSGTLPLVAGRIINALLGILGLLLVVLLVYGGYLWMTAQGDEDQVEKAKRIIRESIIGLVIMLMAYAIARFVIDKLTGAVTGI